MTLLIINPHNANKRNPRATSELNVQTLRCSTPTNLEQNLTTPHTLGNLQQILLHRPFRLRRNIPLSRIQCFTITKLNKRLDFVLIHVRSYLLASIYPAQPLACLSTI